MSAPENLSKPQFKHLTTQVLRARVDYYKTTGATKKSEACAAEVARREGHQGASPGRGPRPAAK